MTDTGRHAGGHAVGDELVPHAVMHSATIAMTSSSGVLRFISRFLIRPRLGASLVSALYGPELRAVTAHARYMSGTLGRGHGR